MKSSSSKLENAKTKAAALKFCHFSTCFVCLHSDDVSMYMIIYSFPQQDICCDQYFIVWLRYKKTHFRIITETSELVPGAWISSSAIISLSQNPNSESILHINKNLIVKKTFLTFKCNYEQKCFKVNNIIIFNRGYKFVTCQSGFAEFSLIFLFSTGTDR